MIRTDISSEHLGDCLELMPLITCKSIDMILCDLPYGVLNKSNASAKWDSVIPFDLLWNQYERIIKDNGIIVLTSQGLFTSDLMLSNRKLWRYNLIWKKGNRTSGFLNANRQPMRNHEDICIFYKSLGTYNPQMTVGEKNHTRGHGKNNKNGCYGVHKFISGDIPTNEKFPISIIDIDKEHPQIHPTQKPVALFEYLIRTYTNEGETVLDNTAGVFTTAIACLNTNRNYIVMEKEQEYFDKGIKRIKEHKSNKMQSINFELVNR